MQTLTFQNITLTPAKIDNQIWLSSSDLAKFLGYKQSNAVSKLYDEYKDEFRSDTTTLIDNPQMKNAKIRIFSLRGCHLIAMFARTKVAKQFRQWVLDILDKEVGQPVVITEQRHTITIEQQAQIRQAIAKRCKNSSTHYQTVYTAIGKHFNIPRYSELLASDFDECMAFIDDFSLAPPAINLSQDDIKTLAKALTYANAYAEFMAKTKDDGMQAVVSTYSNYSHSEDDGFMIVFRPKYKQDIDDAYNVIRRLACAA